MPSLIDYGRPLLFFKVGRNPHFPLPNYASKVCVKLPFCTLKGIVNMTLIKHYAKKSLFFVF